MCIVCTGSTLLDRPPTCTASLISCTMCCLAARILESYLTMSGSPWWSRVALPSVVEVTSTCTPTILVTRPSASLMGVMVRRFQKAVPSFL